MTNFNQNSKGNEGLAKENVAGHADVAANLDLFYQMDTLENDKEKLEELFQQAYQENRDLALASLLYLRDVRKGMNQRKLFRDLLPLLTSKDICRFIELTPEYGRWDDVLWLLIEPVDNEVKRFLMDMIGNQLKSDFHSDKKPSFLAKWMPIESATNPDTQQLARVWSEALGLSPKRYHEILAHVRERGHLDEDEATEAADQPTGTAQDASSETEDAAILPHEIVHRMRWYQEHPDNPDAAERTEYLNKLWADYKLPGAIRNTLVLRDGSYSMWKDRVGEYRLREIVDALTVFFSERLTGAFANQFITFSANPAYVELPAGDPLLDKLVLLQEYEEPSTTDLAKVYDLILDWSKQVTDPKDYIQRLLIMSDMTFASSYELETVINPEKAEATFLLYREKFQKENIPFPELVYWNIESPHLALPASGYDNVKLIRGYSSSVLENILTDNLPDAYDIMMDTLRPYLGAVQDAE